MCLNDQIATFEKKKKKVELDCSAKCKRYFAFGIACYQQCLVSTELSRSFTHSVL